MSWAGAARATSIASPPGCTVAVVPSSLVGIPANVIGLPVIDSSIDAVATLSGVLTSLSHDTIDLGLVRADATGMKYLPITSALVPGRTYGVHVAVRCEAVPPGAPLPSYILTSNLIASEVMALPTRVGYLTSPGTFDWREVTLVPSTELAAYLPFSVMTLSVNGIAEAPAVGLADPHDLTFQANVANAACRTSAAAPWQTGLRTAEISLAAHVLGAATDPTPALLSVSVDCTGVASRGMGGEQAATKTNHGCAMTRRLQANGSAGWLAVAFGLAIGALVRGCRPRRRSRNTLAPDWIA